MVVAAADGHGARSGADGLRGGRVFMDYPSVSGTQNVMMAAVLFGYLRVDSSSALYDVLRALAVVVVILLIMSAQAASATAPSSTGSPTWL